MLPSQVETVSTGADKAKLALLLLSWSLLLLPASICWAKQGAYVRWGVCWFLMAAAGVFLISEPGIVSLLLSPVMHDARVKQGGVAYPQGHCR